MNPHHRLPRELDALPDSSHTPPAPFLWRHKQLLSQCWGAVLLKNSSVGVCVQDVWGDWMSSLRLASLNANTKWHSFKLMKLCLLLSPHHFH